MGQLIAMTYPTNLFARLADHTYVRCGTGAKAWGCWGGKSDGTALRSGSGSTARADAIAGNDERGGITCYLINGVCHQAANRILLPAGITVLGARGYGVSEALFGPYGRPRGTLGTCRAHFYQHPDVTGDLADCVPPVAPAKTAAKKASRATPAKVSAKAAAAAQAAQAASAAERRYLRGALSLYARAGWDVKPAAAGAAAAAVAPEPTLNRSDLEDFELKLFMHQASHRLGATPDRPLSARLQHIRRSAGRSLMAVQDWFTNGEMTPREWAKACDDEALLFQQTAANALKPAQYKAVFGLAPGDFVVLADPRIVKRAFAAP